MQTQSRYRFVEIQSFRVPAWAAPLILVASIALVGLLSLVGLAVVAVVFPLVLVGSGILHLKNWLSQRTASPSIHKPRNRQRTAPLVIDAEYTEIRSQPASGDGEPHTKWRRSEPPRR